MKSVESRLDKVPKEESIKNVKLGTNFTVFVLFFGVATLEAFETKNWVKAGFWLAIGIVFLVADNLKSKHVNPLH